MPEEENDKKKPLVSRYVNFRQSHINATIIPYLFIAYPIAGLLIGMWLDSKFNTDPWLLLVFFLAGMFEAFREMLRIAKRVEREMEEESKKDKRDIEE